MSQMAEAIRELIDERGYTEENVRTIITDSLKSAYKRTYGTDENAVVKFEDDLSDVSIYSRKTVVDGVYDPVAEIELEEAKKLASDVELGDEIDILEDPKAFRRNAVTQGKQVARQNLNETMRNLLVNQYSDKKGQIINGICQKEYNNTIYVNIGDQEHVEGCLPKSLQSPLENYEPGDPIKCILHDIRTSRDGVQLILSRSDPKLVQMIMETQIPELADGTIHIEKAVREAGHRCKVAVSTMNQDVDPVGSCVGSKGMRIQNIIKELLGEKVDIMEYSVDNAQFIKNALSPAKVERVVILDEEKKEALAIVDDTQFALAIGKGGLNVRLANRLTGWSIDVKPHSECEGLDLSEKATSKAAQALFSDEGGEVTAEGELLENLPLVNTDTVFVLGENGVKTVEQFVVAYGEGELDKIDDLTKEEIDDVYKIISEHFDIESGDEEPEEAETEEEVYHCPNCGAVITLDMTRCPSCGAEFEFEEE